MVIDYRTIFGSVIAEEYAVLDAATGEPIDEAVFYADDEAGTYRAYLSMPGEPRFTPYFRHRATHEPLPDGRAVYAGDPDEHDWEVAWAEVRRPIKIVRRDAAGAA